MAPKQDLKLTFQEGEQVLCLHGPLLYEAKVQGCHKGQTSEVFHPLQCENKKQTKQKHLETEMVAEPVTHLSLLGRRKPGDNCAVENEDIHEQS
ncbi:rCG62066 [Rattus norvegicus]|uniref:RCG62066 n=1 Tax=Rattus norvegicus TaxID=10116 RepID=A6HAR6_RAT|nr:rCG62066 [Rattus norvegicus]